MSLQALQTSQSPVEKFREYLASRPKPQRFTGQQRDMVEFIFAQHDHFDADQLIEMMGKAGLDVSRATVYRTLSKLVDAGLLSKIELGPRMCYERAYGSPRHEHLHCGTCGDMIEFQNPAIEEALREVCREHGFRSTGHTLLIKGTCAGCAKAKAPRRVLDLI
ncbi:MAG: transcriptional repressor [Gemmataceae bacterium]|nr:transcriptional repressor [Gemmataceae bacterium]